MVINIKFLILENPTFFELFIFIIMSTIKSMFFSLNVNGLRNAIFSCKVNYTAICVRFLLYNKFLLIIG